MANEKPSRPRHPSGDGLTRSQVARQLGVGITSVHKMRLQGVLRPKRDANGTWRYDPADVMRAAAVRGAPRNLTVGQIAARAFVMFTQGVEMRDIVVALEISPEEAYRLHRLWQRTFDDPPPEPESRGPDLLDEDPHADEAFARAMAQASGIAFPPSPKPKK